jgi:hypothetical protein
MTQLDLERRLADLAPHLEFPPTPPLADEVAARLTPARAPRRPWRLIAVAFAVFLLLGAVAAAIGFGIGAVRLLPATGSLPPLPSALVAERGLGERTTLDAARASLAWEPRLPTVEGLGQPDDAYVASQPTGGVLTLVWRDASGGVALLITQLRAEIAPEAFEKILIEGTRVDATVVGGAPAWWVGGGAHPFFYRDADGRFVDETLRLAEPTLIWEADGLTFRVEGADDVAAARRIAVSLQP